MIGAGRVTPSRRHRRRRAAEKDGSSLFVVFFRPSFSVESSSVPVFAISSPCFIDFHWAEPFAPPVGPLLFAGVKISGRAAAVGRSVGRAERRAGGEDDDVG